MSSWRCPRCKQQALVLGHSLELGPDGDNDELALQSLCCTSCGLDAVGIYRESRRGAGDSWDHTGWPVTDAEAFGELQARLAGCSRPQDKRCDCPAHEHYRVKEQSRWVPLQLVPHDPDGWFSIRA